MTVEEILSELRRSGEPQRVAALKRSGATSPAFGVGLPALRCLAKRIGHDHELALALWQTGVREPRILASLIDKRERVTSNQMDRWAEGFDSWEICDQCCQNLFARTDFALAKAVEWTQRPEEFVKRAAFVLVAVRAVRDKRAADQTLADLLPALIAAADDERVYVRRGASWALRQIGKRSDPLRARVLAAVTPTSTATAAASAGSPATCRGSFSHCRRNGGERARRASTLSGRSTVGLEQHAVRRSSVLAAEAIEVAAVAARAQPSASRLCG